LYLTVLNCGVGDALDHARVEDLDCGHNVERRVGVEVGYGGLDDERRAQRPQVSQTPVDCDGAVEKSDLWLNEFFLSVNIFIF
jgi:hypothetical protein